MWYSVGLRLNRDIGIIWLCTLNTITVVSIVQWISTFETCLLMLAYLDSLVYLIRIAFKCSDKYTVFLY